MICSQKQDILKDAGQHNSFGNVFPNKCLVITKPLQTRWLTAATFDHLFHRLQFRFEAHCSSVSCVFQGTGLARQIGAVAYTECTSKYSENSVRDVFHITTLASVSCIHRPQLKRGGSRRGLKRVSQQPPRTEIHEHPQPIRKDRAKSCVLM